MILRELEGFFAGFVPELLEPALGASMGEDVEEAQELAVDAPGSASLLCHGTAEKMGG